MFRWMVTVTNNTFLTCQSSNDANNEGLVDTIGTIVGAGSMDRLLEQGDSG